jgi:hypothetical protein
LHSAREGAPEPATLITVAHGRALRAALAIAGAETTPASPEPRPQATIEILFEVCARLLAAEEQLGAVEALPATEPALPLEVYPVERCAGIAASMHCRPDAAVTILEALTIEPTLWARLKAYWDEAIDREIKRGKADLVQAYDEAYVAQLERERGEITVEEYVSLKVAAARGTRAGTLAELRVPEQAVMSIERLWLVKIVDNGNLRRRVRRALDQRRSN